VGYWAAVVSAERYAEERLYARERIVLSNQASGEDPFGGHGDAARDDLLSGELVVLAAASEPLVLFGLGRLSGWFVHGARSDVTITYTHRLFDEPMPLGGLALAPGLHQLTPAQFERIAGQVGADLRVDADKSEWLVSVALPIEARSPADAVREFWTYVEKLGPRELPAFVSPIDDELAMQAYVLGDETNLDPEEDDD